MNELFPKDVSAPPPAVMYRAYMLTEADRESLLRLFPTSHPRVIADHISAESLNHMHLVKDGPATGEVIGISDSEGMQSLVVRVNGSVLTSAGTPFHISWSAEPGVSTSRAGEIIKKGGYVELASSIKIDISAGATYSALLRESKHKTHDSIDPIEI